MCNHIDVIKDYILSFDNDANGHIFFDCTKKQMRTELDYIMKNEKCK